MYRSEEEIRRDMLNSIKNTEDKSQNSLIHDALSPASIEFYNYYLQLKGVKEKLDVENLSDEELEMFINQRTGISRKRATKATTIVTISGQKGAEIKKGDLMATDSINFISLENKMIGVTGVMNVLAEGAEYGNIGNVPAGAIYRFPVTIPGLISVTNGEPIVNGYDAETDEDLLQRYYERIRTPATSGNKYHYMNWAKEVIGVGDARVFPLWDGNNTVKVIVIDSNKLPAGGDLVEEVQNYIDPNISGLGEGVAPIGAFCTVVSAIGKEINITFKVARDINYTLEQVETNVSGSITEYLKSIAFKETLISYAKVGATILASEGVLDYSNLKINNGASNIVIADQEVAMLGEVIISE